MPDPCMAMMNQQTTQTDHTAVDALLLLGAPGQNPLIEAEQRQLLSLLVARLALPSASCWLEFREQPALAAIQCCREANCRHMVVLPLALERDDHRHEAIFGTIDWERVRNPQMAIHVGAALGVQTALVQALAERVVETLSLVNTAIPRYETTVLVVGRGGKDPENNADIAKVARLLWEGRPYSWVETGYYSQTQPDITTALQRCVQLGARQIIVAPYWLYPGQSGVRMATQVQAFQSDYPGLPIHMAAALGAHPGVVEALARQVGVTMNGQTPSFLPPRYRNGAPVSAVPMAAAPLLYDAEGHVAWDKMWGTEGADNPFCALALAGGPPHRGTLLEPVTSAEVGSDWVGYTRVLAELTRGIQMTTGLQTQLSRTPGWIGVQCHSAEMALWLLRAIVVENVSVRREDDVLYLPASPTFRLEDEIKNVITALVKTYHYWQEHLHS